MSTGIAKSENRSRRFNVIGCLFVILSGILLMSGSGRAADLGLISAAGLHENLAGWIVIDARPKNAWLSGHIPGAFSFSWEDYTRTDEKGIPYRIMPPEYLAGALGKMGISSQTPLVVYGDADTSWGGEGWACWVLAWLGHKGPVRLLDGGIQAWAEKKYPLQPGITRPEKPADYQFVLNDAVLISAARIHEHRQQDQLVDVRSTWEWVKGRLPDATRIFWEQFYEGPHRRPLTPDKTRALLETNGIDPAMPVVYYCTGGIRSAYAWMVHTLAGLPAAVNFEGGTEEWEKAGYE